MKVTLHSPLNLGNKSFNKGSQELPDHLYANESFRKAVKSGVIVVHPRDADAQAVQASKDARAVQKAVMAKKMSEQEQDARSKLSNNKLIDDGSSPMSFEVKSEKQASEPLKAQAAPAKPSAASQADGKSN